MLFSYVFVESQCLFGSPDGLLVHVLGLGQLLHGGLGVGLNNLLQVD